MPIKILPLLGTTLLVAFTSLSNGKADTLPVPMLDGISPNMSENYYTGTVGYEFTTGTNTVLITALGYIDAAGAGLQTSHQVGVWLPGNPTAIAQVTVPAGTAGTLVGNYWYANLTAPVTLAKNTTYFIAAAVIQGGDPWQDLGANPNFTSPVFNGFIYGGSGFSAAVFSPAAFGVPTNRGRAPNDNGIFDTVNLLGKLPDAAIAPAITQQPQAGTRLLGDIFTLTVQAAGTPLNYQWRFGVADLANATNNTYTIPALQLTNAGDYTVIISNSAGSVTSSIATLVITNPPLDITSDLLVWLKFDETTGLTATDATANHNNGTLQGFAGDDTQWVAGRINGAISFDPQVTPGEAVLVTDPGQLDFSTNKEFTLSAWVNGPSVQQEAAGIIAKGYNGGGEQFVLDITGGNYRFYGFAADGTSVCYLLNPPIGPNGTWQHLVAVFSQPLNLVRLYINGNQVAQGTPLPTLLQNNHEISIGSRQSVDAGPYNLNFRGKIDDVHIYNRVFTTADVQALYNQAALAAPNIVQQPQGNEFYVCNESTVLSVVVDGSVPLSYQWQKDGNSISGATNATLNLDDIQAISAGTYRVVVSNSVSSLTSSNAVITVLPANQGRLFHDLNATGNRDDFSGTIGTEFATGNDALTFTALGYEDAGRDGLNGSHQVGLFDTNGNQIAGVVVPAGTSATLQGAWRYVALDTPVTVPANTICYIGAEVIRDDGDGWSDNGFSTVPPSGFTCHATAIDDTYTFGALNFPNMDGGGGSILRWSPANAQFTVISTAAPSLSLSRSGATVTVSWPADVTGYVLQSSATLPTSSWTAVTGVVNNSVTLNIGSGAQFFRLLKQ